jgi:hypothetical protein
VGLLRIREIARGEIGYDKSHMENNNISFNYNEIKSLYQCQYSIEEAEAPPKYNERGNHVISMANWF